jgi:hypothetical protein
MAETAQSDLDLGVSLLFAFVTVLAAVAMAWAAYAAYAQESDSMQLLSGVALTIALLAGGIAVAAVHLFE